MTEYKQKDFMDAKGQNGIVVKELNWEQRESDFSPPSIIEAH